MITPYQLKLSDIVKDADTYQGGECVRMSLFLLFLPQKTIYLSQLPFNLNVLILPHDFQIGNFLKIKTRIFNNIKMRTRSKNSFKN